ncbi:unnamed protein product, partial [Cylicocyclus nassatus]
MDEVTIPNGKQLRFRCKYKNCTTSKTFSIISIMDHLALHFSQQRRSTEIFNFYCKECRVHFLLCGMCKGCKCKAKGGGKQFILLKNKVTLEDIKREVNFFEFLQKWIAPVLTNKPGPKSAAFGLTPTTPQPADTNGNDASEQGPLPRESRSRSRTLRPTINSRTATCGRPVPPPLPQRRVSRSSSVRPKTPASAKSLDQTQKDERRVPTASKERRSRSDARARQACSVPPRSRQVSRSPETRSPAQSGPADDINSVSSFGGEICAILRMPSCYPDGTPRSPAFDDDEEEIGPAYYSSIRNRSPSCSRTPMTDIEQERHSLGPSAENENPVTSLWSSSLPEPRMFSNVFLQQQERASSAESVGQTEQQPTRRPVPAQEAAITVLAEPDESLPLPAPPQPPSVPPVSLNDDHETPDIIMIPPPPPAISSDAQPSSQPGADDQISIQDKNAKRRLTGTARVFSKKSRQDGLLEENPSPPRSPRRGISRSPGPHVPMSPFWKQPSTKTPAHEPDLENHVSASDSRTEFTCSPSFETPHTPAYGSATSYSTQSPRYCSGSPTYGESALSLYGGRRSNARCATSYWNGGQSPIGRPNTPSYARTPGQSSRPSTPRPPSYAASSPRYAGDDLEGGSQVASGGSDRTQSRNDERR